MPWPNPNPWGLLVKCDGPVERLHWKAYGEAMVCLAQGDIHHLRPGWSQVTFDSPGLGALPNGTFYLCAASGEDKGAKKVTCKLSILR